MIVRILGEAQYELDASAVARIEALDAVLSQALGEGDEARFAKALETMLTEVRTAGRKLEATDLLPSDLALPGEGSSLEEVRELLGHEATEGS